MIHATPDLAEKIDAELGTLDEAIEDLERLADRFKFADWTPSSLNELEVELLDRKDELEQLLDALTGQDEQPAA